MTLEIPEGFSARMRKRPGDIAGIDGAAWLRKLPGIIDERLDQWHLQPDGEAQVGECAVVLPVRRGRERLALKVTWPHAEARHEHLALRAWRGVGCVRLEAAHPADWALLLERCEPAHELAAMSALDVAEIVGTIHARLRRPTLPQLDRASAWLQDLAERLVSSPPPVPRRMVQQGISLAGSLAEREGIDDLLVHTDLHEANVMRAGRANTVGGYVAIDPKPMSGDLAMAVAPLIWNRWDEAASAYNMRAHLRFRVDYVCDPMGVDPARARAWTILRMLAAAWHVVDDARRAAHDAPDMTRTVAIIKAMQD